MHLIETPQADLRKFDQTRAAAANFARAAGAPGAMPLFDPMHLKRQIRRAGTDLPTWLATTQTRSAAPIDRAEL